MNSCCLIRQDENFALDRTGDRCRAISLASEKANISMKQQQKRPFKSNGTIMRPKSLNIVWSLVLCALLQSAADLILSNHHDHSQPQPQHQQQHQQSRHNSLRHSDQDCLSNHNYVHNINNNNNRFNELQIFQHYQDGCQVSVERKQQQLKPSCSSEAKISTKQSLLSPSSSSSSSSSTLPPCEQSKVTARGPTYLSFISSTVVSFTNHLSRAVFGPKVLIAQAAPNNALYQAELDKEIIVLNSTNFNTELIQNKHPFPHIKLIEYYLPYCGICLKFKAIYSQLAREIHPWRNVIRPSAIDLGVSSNSPIAHSWSIDVIPTLRIHPPPNAQQASRLNKQLTTLSSTGKTSSELQRSMYEEYNGQNLFISSLGVVKYTTANDKKELHDKVALLKMDLLRYIESFVSKYPAGDEMPATWPNLRPVTETSLMELRLRHPRQELFLIVETGGPSSASTSDSDQSSSSSSSSSSLPSLGLSVMMELSSSPVWKAIRYVRASENRALIEDVIAQKRREESSEQINEGGRLVEQNNNSESLNEQVKLLNNLLADSKSIDAPRNIMLIHIDNSHSPQGQMQTPIKFPIITIVTGSDLVTIERSAQLHQQQQQYEQQQQLHQTAARSRRSINHQIKQTTTTTAYLPQQRNRRSLFTSDGDEFDQASLQRKIELMTLYVNQTYTETKEDREFMEALSSLDEDPTAFGAPAKREAIEKFHSSLSRNNNQVSSSSSSSLAPIFTSTSSTSPPSSNGDNQQLQNKPTSNDDNSFLALINSLNPFDPDKAGLFVSSNDGCHLNDDYEDKLKALRYMFFNEIPRKSLIDKSLVEKQEKLNTLIDLVAVIKSYFPMPDAASVQFIDGVQAYLMKQQSLLSSINSQDRATGNLIGFDTVAFKRELKRLEAEGKRIPEIREWKHCKLSGGYSCALWRLFHTLTAFEYKKLSQIYQQHQQQQQVVVLPPQQQQQSSTGLQGSLVNENQSQSENQQQQQQQVKDIKLASTTVTSQEGDQNGSQLSPVERLVSPPSTTTSLSLTIATPINSSNQQDSLNTNTNTNNINNINGNNNNNNLKNLASEIADLPMPVLLVMRDYITNFFGCEECGKNFKQETSGLSLDRIRQQQPAEFSILWLWETHNRVSKRLSVDPETNPKAHPKNWFPTYEQCSKCYKKAPSFLGDKTIEPSALFHESIEWNRGEVLEFLLKEYTRQPMDKNGTNIFGYQVPYGFGCIIIISVCSLLLIVLLRLASCYIERQRRHKASLLNGNGAHYSLELQ